MKLYHFLALASASIASAAQSHNHGFLHQWFKGSKPEAALEHDEVEAQRVLHARQSTSTPSVGSGSSGNWSWTSYGDDSTISPVKQCGYSRWGTLGVGTMPEFSQYGANGKPWGQISTSNANPYTSSRKSITRVRNYQFSLAPCDIRPDGVVTKNAVCINGQFPGPLIEANYGDTINVAVTNNLKDEGTAMHWHGFLQMNNCQNDGVPGVQQCPIAPGRTYTYTMKAELYGSSWYHTHYSAQYAGGAVGPIVVYGPWNSKYDVDVGPVMLHEWYRQDYTASIKQLFRPLKQGGPIEPVANSNLIQGKMRFPCDKTSLQCEVASYAKFNFTSGKNHKLRLMNVGAAAVQKFSIDGHTMQVIATDYMPVKPFNVSIISLAVGQRADVIVFGSGKPREKYWMRSNIAGCSVNDGVLTEAKAQVLYEGAWNTRGYPAGKALEQGPGQSTDTRSCANDALAVTEPTFKLPAVTPDKVQTFDIRTQSNGTNIVFTLNNSTFRANFNQPLLWKVLNNTLASVDKSRNLWDLGDDAKVARAVVYNYNHAPHPMHYHGHNMQVLAVGMGKWDGTIVRPTNPQRRDVALMPPAASETVPSYLVLQWDVDNPGVWPFHCHFAWHSSMGLVVNVVEQKSIIKKTLAGAVKEMQPTCDGWYSWLSKHGALLSGVDSGL